MTSQSQSIGSDLKSMIHHNLRLGPIVYRKISELKGYERRLKAHSEDTILALMASLRVFSMVSPLAIDANATVIDGEALLEAARRLGMTEVPTVTIDHLSDSQIRLLRLTLKKLAMRSQWNAPELKLELGELMQIDDEIALDVTGFSMPEIDVILSQGGTVTEAEAPEAVPEPILPENAVARLGDVWTLGRHRVLCGSSLEVMSFQILMGDERARMVMSDSPYNVRIANNVSGHGRTKHREFLQGSGELTSSEFQQFQIDSMRLHGMFCVDGGLLYMFMDFAHGGEMYRAIDTNDFTLTNLAVWAKTNAGNAPLYRPQHELCFIAKVGSAPYLNNVQMAKHGRNRSNLWTFPGMNSFGKDRDELLAMHPTVKNLDMICEAIRDVTNRGDIVLDGFLGSGTTLIAAEKTGRVCRGIELDPLYVDCIIRRWEKMTGLDATLGDVGLTFAEVAVTRSIPSTSIEPIAAPQVRTRIRPVLA